MLHDLIDTLPLTERYTLRLRGQLAGARPHPAQRPASSRGRSRYDVVHVNAEFADQASDHDPQVARLTLPKPATSLAVAPATGTYGGTTTLSATLTLRRGAGSRRGLSRFTLNGAWASAAQPRTRAASRRSAASPLRGIGAGTLPGRRRRRASPAPNVLVGEQRERLPHRRERRR